MFKPQVGNRAVQAQIELIEVHKRSRSSYAIRDSAEAARVLAESDSRIALQSELARASFGAASALASPATIAAATAHSESAVRRGMRALSAGRVPGQQGRPPTLHADAEKELERWARARIDENREATIPEIIEKATQLRLAYNRTVDASPVSRNWAVNFVKRHNLALKIPETVEQVCSPFLLPSLLFASLY